VDFGVCLVIVASWTGVCLFARLRSACLMRSPATVVGEFSVVRIYR
jgi:hypothetical protein